MERGSSGHSAAGGHGQSTVNGPTDKVTPVGNWVGQREHWWMRV